MVMFPAVLKKELQQWNGSRIVRPGNPQPVPPNDGFLKTQRLLRVSLQLITMPNRRGSTHEIAEESIAGGAEGGHRCDLHKQSAGLRILPSQELSKPARVGLTVSHPWTCKESSLLCFENRTPGPCSLEFTDLERPEVAACCETFHNDVGCLSEPRRVRIERIKRQGAPVDLGE